MQGNVIYLSFFSKKQKDLARRNNFIARILGFGSIELGG